MLASVIGYPRIGVSRELKFWTEAYFKNNLTERKLRENARELRSAQWKTQWDSGIDLIPSNDFSFYDGMLDTAVLLGVVPKRYRKLNLGQLDTYFSMARGYQGDQGDIKALPMRKWFNTNYHYIVPEFDEHTKVRLSDSKPLDEYMEAKSQGIQTKPVIIGPLTFLRLSSFTGGSSAEDHVDDLIEAYARLLTRLDELGAEWVQLDEPILVTDLDHTTLLLFRSLYTRLLRKKGRLKILLQTTFGDIRDCYRDVTALPFDGIGLDFIEGKMNRTLLAENGFPDTAILFAGVVNGKNIWKNDRVDSRRLIRALRTHAEHLAVSTSCSLLHVPYTIQTETKMDEATRATLAFAQEKLFELAELKTAHPHSQDNQERPPNQRQSDLDVQLRINRLTDADFTRSPTYEVRRSIQHEALQLPILPTTTIGSFPQTQAVKINRRKYRNGKCTAEEYQDTLHSMIARCVASQEALGLDVLVHGEFERADMVAYFGENLSGFLFTEQAWVQSYGTRCVKPPIIWGDIKRMSPITVDISAYAQSLTGKPVKGMLTGPVTILNWSFPREDISPRETALQIALAIRDEVLDLEAAGLRIIQVDEAALKEKLPLRKADWHKEYLDWAIPAFRLTHSGVKAKTQIHTHMCYSEFQDIIGEIDAMDADVISFESARSNLSIVDAIGKSGFKTAVGPGIYDIHSPRIPSSAEFEAVIGRLLEVIPPEKLWINPDCGLKTRGEEETDASLRNLVDATDKIRRRLAEPG